MSSTRQSEPLTLAELTWNACYRRRLLKAGPRRCAYCGKRVGYKTATLDHIVPRRLSGPNVPENLTLACKPCNQSKAGRDVFGWVSDILAAAGAAGVLR
jgi:5-methylcytosine-specific restriction endonuclease McrA